MAPTIRKVDVVVFLTEMKKALSLKNALQLVDRTKNMRYLAQLGYTIADVKLVLYRLSVADYCSGPERDHNCIIRSKNERLSKGGALNGKTLLS